MRCAAWLECTLAAAAAILGGWVARPCRWWRSIRGCVPLAAADSACHRAHRARTAESHAATVINVPPHSAVRCHEFAVPFRYAM